MNPAAIVLAEYRKARAVPFAWGIADCLGWASDVANALLDRGDVIAELRGRYTSSTGSLRIMVERGWKNLGDVAATYFAEIPTAQARAGDWAIIANADGTETIGVFAGAMIAAKTERGMGQVPRSHATRAFRVE